MSVPMTAGPMRLCIRIRERPLNAAPPPSGTTPTAADGCRTRTAVRSIALKKRPSSCAHTFNRIDQRTSRWPSQTLPPPPPQTHPSSRTWSPVPWPRPSTIFCTQSWDWPRRTVRRGAATAASAQAARGRHRGARWRLPTTQTHLADEINGGKLDDNIRNNKRGLLSIFSL